ncbi:MAG: 3-phosphoshikimate 1-carboxyvinyltransferase [Oligoflexia bacterium]|nr:3-phosphoshikimate 1-carboxyvinyltransferase [Oligoflexia bacterium]
MSCIRIYPIYQSSINLTVNGAINSAIGCTISCTIKAPSSKSAFQRVVAISCLTHGITKINYSTLCDDTRASLQVAKALGAKVQISPNVITINMKDRKIKDKKTNVPRKINCDESGLCFRMFAPIVALGNQQTTLCASGSLTKRPIHFVEETLRQLGVQCATTNGFPPMDIKGPIRMTEQAAGGVAVTPAVTPAVTSAVTVDGSISSQLLTGLLIALPCIPHHCTPRTMTLIVENLKSRPYIDLTIKMLQQAGAIIHSLADYTRFDIPVGQTYKPQTWNIEGDWSSAAFLLVASAIAKKDRKIEITDLDPYSTQADKDILKALALALPLPLPSPLTGTHNREGGNLKAFEFDATECPDLFPPLVSLAANCQGTSILHGIRRLYHKESNRAEVLCSQFKKIGVDIEVSDIHDTMTIRGPSVLGGRAHAHGDHRIAMALAIAALGAKNPVEIENYQCVSKSYESFFDDLEKLGLKMEIIK